MDNNKNSIVEIQNINNKNMEVIMKETEQKSTIINGITVIGEKEVLPVGRFRMPETASVNFTGPDSNNVNKIAVYLLRKEVYGRILSPDDGDLNWLVHTSEILAEDEDSFIVPNDKFTHNVYLMKHVEKYSFFRIVETDEEVDAITDLIYNYAGNIYDQYFNEYPFGDNMLEALEDSIGDDYRGNTTEEEQQNVIDKLNQTKFSNDEYDL